MNKYKIRFTNKEDRFIKNNYLELNDRQLAEALSKNKGSIRGRRIRIGCNLPREIHDQRRKDSLYYKGQVSWNKGLKGLCIGGKETQFKKGHLPKNTLYDGAIRIRVDHKRRGGKQYKWIRISRNKWEMLHVHIWKKAGREIPNGMILSFKDGNPLNTVLSNLKLMTRKQNLERNSPPGSRKAPASYPRYWAAMIVGKKNKADQDELIKNNPEIIELLKTKAKLGRVIKHAS